MIKDIISADQYNNVKSQSDAVLFYFSHEECNVCKVLKPKIEELIINTFPKIEIYYVNTKNHPEIIGQERIFTVPTISVFIDGKEFLRKSRNIGIGELEADLERPYNIFFS